MTGRTTPYSPYKVLRIEAVCDYEFYTSAGANNYNTALYMMDQQLNIAEAVYESQLGITFSVSYYQVYFFSDPYTYTGDSDDISLGRFQSDLNTNHPSGGTNPVRDVALLFSAYDPVNNSGFADGGRAVTINAICNPTYGYALIGRMNKRDPNQGLVTAHEIAHLLGANHLDTVNNLMRTKYTTTTLVSFAPFTLSEIWDAVDSSGAYCGL